MRYLSLNWPHNSWYGCKRTCHLHTSLNQNSSQPSQTSSDLFTLLKKEAHISSVMLTKFKNLRIINPSKNLKKRMLKSFLSPKTLRPRKTLTNPSLSLSMHNLFHCKKRKMNCKLPLPLKTRSFPINVASSKSTLPLPRKIMALSRVILCIPKMKREIN